VVNVWRKMEECVCGLEEQVDVLRFILDGCARGNRHSSVIVSITRFHTMYRRKYKIEFTVARNFG
jgi:hypothetical protein